MDPTSDLLALDRIVEMCVARLRVLENDIAVLETEKERIEAVIDGIVNAKQEMGLLGVVPNVLSGDEPPSGPQRTNYERIVEFLVAQGNRPQTIGQIEQGTGIPRSSVSAVVYRTHSGKFYVREHSGKQANTWQLREDVLADQAYQEEPAPSNGEDIPF
jgi:hypothetical protein